MKVTSIKATSLFITMTSWLILSTAHAQPESNIALKGGPNAATLDHDFRVNEYGFSGGLAGNLQWSIVDQFSLASQVELLYTPRGAKTIFQGEYLGKVRQHYIDVIVAARPELRLCLVNVYLLLGGGLNLLVSAASEDASGTQQDITGGLRRIDVALLVGAGVALHLPDRELGPFRLGTVFLEARHDIGLLDTDPAGNSFKNRTSSLMLGLSFVIGGPPSHGPTPNPSK